jgi:hypothetical protein
MYVFLTPKMYKKTSDIAVLNSLSCVLIQFTCEVSEKNWSIQFTYHRPYQDGDFVVHCFKVKYIC